MSKPREVRTRSVPTAGALMLMGHRVLRIEHRDHGGSLLVFEPSAKTTLDQFIAFKEDADGLIAEADLLR